MHIESGDTTAVPGAAMGGLSVSNPMDFECPLPVVERFTSVNGEGPRAGRLAAFIRFAGCNLACSWCDTAWANVGDCQHEDLALYELVEWVAGTGAACVTLTGGEPALQPGLPALIEALCCSDIWGGPSDAQRVVEVETNGAVDLAELDALRGELAQRGLSETARTQVCFTVDCKMPSSGMAAEMLPSNYSLLREGDAVKFVVGSHEDLECAARAIEEHDLCSRCEVFLSPVFSCIDPADIVIFMEQNRMTRVRLQLQLHKIIWPNQDRGV